MDNSLNPKDIIKIIEACNINNVAKFTYNSLNIEFLSKNSIKIDNITATEIETQENEPLTLLETLPPEKKEIVEQIQQDLKLQEAFEENPLEYERLYLAHKANAGKVLEGNEQIRY